MLNKIRYILFIVIIIYCIYNFIYYNVDIPFSIMEGMIKKDASIIGSICIDETKNIIYLTYNISYKKSIYISYFSKNDNIREMLRNLTGEYYNKINISYLHEYTVNNLIYGIMYYLILINIIYYIFSIIIPFSLTLLNLLNISNKNEKKEDNDINEKDDENTLLNLVSNLKSNDNYYSIIKKSDIKFSDIIGLESVKEDLTEFIKYLRYQDIYKSNGCSLSKGLLFIGPPGIGKTYIAKAFASESNATFIYTTGSNFNEIFIGTGPKRIRSLFRYARQHTPCIIFIDEIDALGARNKSTTDINDTINALLTELDGLETVEGIFVIAATNLDVMLDSAMTRSGRFDKKIFFDYPTYEERIDLFKMYLGKVKLDDSFNYQCDIKLLAQRTAKLTGADIKNICNQGILNHMKQYTIYDEIKLENTSQFNGCTLKDLNEALDDINIGNKRTIMNNKERIQTAYHEAGHTLVSYLIEYGVIPIKVSIIPRGYALGFTQPTPNDNKLLFKKEIIAQICILLGGRIAEQIQFNDITIGAHDDLKKVSEITSVYYMDYCFGERIYKIEDKLQCESYKSSINKLCTDLTTKCYDYVYRLINENRTMLSLIAKNLLKKETLSNTDLVRLLGKKKIKSYVLINI